MDYTKTSDAGLVLLTLGGESSAYEELVVRYQSVMKGMRGLRTRSGR